MAQALAACISRSVSVGTAKLESTSRRQRFLVDDTCGEAWIQIGRFESVAAVPRIACVSI